MCWGRFLRVLRQAGATLPMALALMLVVVGSSSKGCLAVPRGSTRAPTCEECFFHRNALCALPDREPCATFRPHHPEGLRPPDQLRLVFRAERRTRAAWSFPTAAEQAALYA